MRGLKRLYDWVLTWADRPGASPALAALSFAESSVFPVPPDPLLMALCFGKPRSSLRFALICTVASVLGGVFGYLLGWAFQDFITVVLRYVVDAFAGGGSFLGSSASTHVLDGNGAPMMFGTYPVYADGLLWKVTQLYRDNAFLAVLAAAMTPIPYKVFTVTAGYCEISLATFVVASILGRGARFFAIGALIYIAGPKMKAFIDRYFTWVMISFFVLLGGGFMAVRIL